MDILQELHNQRNPFSSGIAGLFPQFTFRGLQRSITARIDRAVGKLQCA